MRKILLLLVILLFDATLLAQVVIPMEKEGGVYKVPCVVNGAKMKFIFDTGAANVCLSLSMAEYLFDNDYITINDFIGSGKSQVADGRIVNHLKLVLRDVEIGGKHIKNVEAVVIEEQRAPLLLGQSAIQKLGDVVISGNKLIIRDKQNMLSVDDAEMKCSQAENLFVNGQYYAAASKYEGIENAGFELNKRHYKLYVSSLYMAEEYDRCIAACTRWLNNHQYTEDMTSKALYASMLARSYRLSSPPAYDESNKWYRVAYRCMEGNSDYSDMMKLDMLRGIGMNLSAQQNYREIIRNNHEKINLFRKSKLTPDEKRETLIDIYHQKSEIAIHDNDMELTIAYVRVMAYYGDEESIQLCRRWGYSYNYEAVRNYLIVY